MKPSVVIYLALPLVFLAGCATVPSGPSVMVLPGSGKNFDQFRADDVDCRRYAQYQIGGTDANQTATDAGLKSAAIGTAIGAVAGAAMGGHDGAGAGAATGLLFGSVMGAGAADASARGTQRGYDNAYVQCMYAKGNQVPTSGSVQRRPVQVPEYATPAPTMPPASANYPPPPPPGR